jgi:PAS domain S-box-containing protein
MVNPAPTEALEERAFLRLYNERLVQKLDHRNAVMADQLAALQEAEARLRLKGAALEAAANGIMMTDLSGTILWVNQAFLAMTGYAMQDLLGMNARILRSGVHPPEFYQELWTTILTGKTWQQEVVNRRKDGTLRTFQSSITPLLDDQGIPTHFIAISDDITERKRTEAELRQAQKMDAVGRLAGGVAHDYNNMLNIILLNTELLFMANDLTEAQRKHVQEIENAAHRSADLTRQLLAFSRKQVAQPKRIALNEVVAQCQSMLRRLLPEDIELSFTPASDLWTVIMDPSQLNQILINLVVNSRDALTGAGAITIETANTQLDGSSPLLREGPDPGDFVLLTVSDTGSGMNANTLDHIFEPFFTTKGVGKGTGLGLSTVYGIVKQNHGIITAYSQEGMGTTLKIYLPRCQEAPDAQAAVVPEVPPRGTETILLAEDEEALRTTMKQALEGLGYKVLTGPDPMAVFELAERHPDPIHLLVTDVVMPGLNGKELQERLSRLKPGIKILFMSGYTAEIIAKRGLVAKQTHFLQKPFRILDLARKVRAALDE